MPKRTKQLMSLSYKHRFDGMEDAVFVNCSTLTAEEAVAFRSTLRESGARVTIVKNSLASNVLQDLGLEMPQSCFSGPTAVVYGEVDAVTASKAISDWSKDNGNKVTIKAGVLAGSVLHEKEALQLTKLPSLPEIKQLLVSAIAGPLTNMVGVTNSILTGVPGVLQAIADKKKEEGE